MTYFIIRLYIFVILTLLVLAFALPTIRSAAHAAIIGGLCESKTLRQLADRQLSHKKISLVWEIVRLVPGFWLFSSFYLSPKPLDLLNEENAKVKDNR